MRYSLLAFEWTWSVGFGELNVLGVWNAYSHFYWIRCSITNRATVIPRLITHQVRINSELIDSETYRLWTGRLRNWSIPNLSTPKLIDSELVDSENDRFRTGRLRNWSITKLANSESGRFWNLSTLKLIDFETDRLLIMIFEPYPNSALFASSPVSSTHKRPIATAFIIQIGICKLQIVLFEIEMLIFTVRMTVLLRHVQLLLSCPFDVITKAFNSLHRWAIIVILGIAPPVHCNAVATKMHSPQVINNNNNPLGSPSAQWMNVRLLRNPSNSLYSPSWSPFI